MHFTLTVCVERAFHSVSYFNLRVYYHENPVIVLFPVLLLWLLYKENIAFFFKWKNKLIDDCVMDVCGFLWIMWSPFELEFLCG